MSGACQTLPVTMEPPLAGRRRMDQEQLTYDVVIAGAGPAGLAAACRLKQRLPECSVCVLEKGSEVGAHILSGALFDTRALDELFPDWAERGAPMGLPVNGDEVHFLLNDRISLPTPTFAIPKPMHNRGCHIISLGLLCRWLGQQAEALGVDLFPGFAAADLLIGEQGQVEGVITGDQGRNRAGEPKAGFQPGMAVRGRYSLIAEGCRGHLGKQLIRRFRLASGKEPQHYGLGLKETWEVDGAHHQPGKVIHGAGWPLAEHKASGGFFLYHGADRQVSVGLIMDLNYTNPWLNPFAEFQRLKHHPLLASVLAGGTRLSYGARTVAKGGLHSLPRMSFPGGLLIGCDAGTLNFSRIKGSHTAMKSGLLAADTVADALQQATPPVEPGEFQRRFRQSWLFDELYASRNFGAALHRLGTLGGAAYNFTDQNLLAGRLPLHLADSQPDHDALQDARHSPPIPYPKPDGRLSFDLASSVYLSNTHHADDQPCHLRLLNPGVPIRHNLPRFAEPAQRYCPAGVYEVLDNGNGTQRLQINSQNCLHCKTCDIKDPAQNIQWHPPEAGGPHYLAM